jgi:hypothetical protein
VKRKRRSLSIPPRAQVALAIAAPVVIVAAGWFLAVAPQRTTAADLRHEAAAVQGQIAATRAALVRRAKPERISVADIFRLTRAMPDTEDMPGMILQLNAVARDAGITFTSITPAASSDQAGYTVRQIELTFSGDFYGLSEFLYRLRSLVDVRRGELDASGRLFSVQSLSFGQGDKGFPQIDAKLTVNAFVYGTAPAPAPPADTTATTTGETTTSTTSTTTTTTTATTTPSGSGSVASGAAASGVNG